MADAKRTLRREILARRRELTPEAREAAGARISELLTQTAEFAAARRIVMYAALEFEAPTALLAEAALAANKELLWPRVRAADDIEVARGERLDEFEPDASGVLAPVASIRAGRIAPYDLVLVPGVAFTRRGARLGRGGGLYDRLLANAGEAISIGLAFDIQLVDEIPAEPHDRSVEIVATPSGLWRNTR